MDTPLHSEDDVLFALLLYRYNRPNLHPSEPLCDMERWAGMGSGRKHWLPHGRIRMPDLNRNFGVGSDLAPRDFFQCIPDLDLELGPLKRWVLGHMCPRCLDDIILPIYLKS